MYKDGWWLGVKTARIPWVLTPEAIKPFAQASGTRTTIPTELYYLPDDFSQAHDLAAERPDKVDELKDLFWKEAERYDVLPLLAPLSAFFGQLPPLPEIAKFEYRGDVQNVMPGMIPRVYNHSYTISADLVVPSGGAEGVIVANCDHLGGFSLWVDEREADPHLLVHGRVHLPPAGDRSPCRRATSASAWSSRPTRRSRPRAARSRCSSTTGQSVKGGWTTRCPSASPAMPRWTSGATTAASSTGATSHRKPFPFNGTIRKVVFDVAPHLEHEEAELHAVASHAAAGHALGE